MAPFYDNAEPADCREIWQDLVNGRCKIVASFATLERAYLAVARTETRRARVTGRSLEILERVLIGTSAKVVAIELGLAHSTISGSLRHSLETLGLTDPPSRVPLGLAMLVRAARDQDAGGMQQNRGLICHGVACDILSAPLRSLEPLLSPAVRDVAYLHAQGNSHAQIAARRRTSERTVANQLAKAFHRLGISGRAGLLGYLIVTPRAAVRANNASC